MTILRRVAATAILGASVGLTGCCGTGWQFTMGKPAVISNPATQTVVMAGQGTQQLTHLGGTVVPSAVLPEAAAPIQGPTVRAAGLPAGPRLAATAPGEGCTCEDLLRELRAINRKLDAQGKPDVTVPRQPMPPARD